MADRLLTIGDVYKPLQAGEVLNFMVAKDTMEQARIRNRIDNMLLAEKEGDITFKNQLNQSLIDNPTPAGQIVKVPSELAAQDPLRARRFEQEQQAAGLTAVAGKIKMAEEIHKYAGRKASSEFWNNDPDLVKLGKAAPGGDNEIEPIEITDAQGNKRVLGYSVRLPDGKYHFEQNKPQVKYQDVGTTPDGRTVSFNPDDGLRYVETKGGKLERYTGKVQPKTERPVSISINNAGQGQVEALAKGILDGTIDPNGISKRGGLQAAVWGRVKELNPQFDIVGAGVQAKFRGSTGTMQTKALLNSIEPLLTKLEESGKVLGNDRFQFVNRPKNWLKEQMGYDDIVGFNNLRDDTIAEVERGLLGTGVLSDSKYLRAVKNINSAQSFSQLQAALRNIRFVIEARLEALAAGPETKETNRPKGDLTKQVNSWEALKKKRGW